MRVLVVEDEPGIANFVRQGLTEAGHAVDVAWDGEEGLDYALAADYDVLILDIMLPKMDGLELLRELRGAAEQRARDDLATLCPRFCDAVAAHFGLEEDVVFPALHGLCPERVADLERLSEEHAAFRQRVAELGQLVEAGELERFGRRFAALMADLERHERLEEQLVGDLAESPASGA